MNRLSELRSMLARQDLDPMLTRLYCTKTPDELVGCKQRYLSALDSFEALFGERPVAIFSAPGRTEIGGNHTDHQHGRVLAASVNLDVIAIVSPRNDKQITVKSEGFEADCLLADELAIRPEEKGKSAALIRGMCSGFERHGFQCGGFDAYTTSNVLKGSGLSSSAAFEVLIGSILNHLYNDGRSDPVTIAQIAQFAERDYFGKPCGLMDQTASSVGGFVSIDFNNPQQPVVKKLPFQFEACGHALIIVDTKGDHADLTADYAAIGEEMRSVAAYFGKAVLRDVNPEEFSSQIHLLRGTVGDRAILRAIHFFRDNELAYTEAKALEAGDFEAFKQQVISSGRSSFMFLQNAYSISAPHQQGIPLALSLSESLLAGKGAWRVHGGGFAGTIQAFVPVDMVKDYCSAMEAVFGKNTCHILSIRPVGAVKVI